MSIEENGKFPKIYNYQLPDGIFYIPTLHPCGSVSAVFKALPIHYVNFPVEIHSVDPVTEKRRERHCKKRAKTNQFDEFGLEGLVYLFQYNF